MTIHIKYITIGSTVNVYSYNPYDPCFNPSQVHTATVTSVDIPNQQLSIKWTIRNDVQTIFINQVCDKFDTNNIQHRTRSQIIKDDDTVLVTFQMRNRQEDMGT